MSPVHLILLEPGELFTVTPMGAKQTRHYQAIREADSDQSNQLTFQHLEAFFKTLNPGLGLISQSHRVYRYDLRTSQTEIIGSFREFIEALQSDSPQRLYSGTGYYER